MTNDELQMTKEIRSSKVERRAGVRSAVSSFGFLCSFGFRESSFGFGDCGSWGALFRFFTCIGAKNPPLTPPRRGTFAAESMDHAVAFGVRASSAPLSQGRLQFDGRAGSWRASFRLFACIGTMNRPVGTPLVWSSAFRRSGPAKAGTPNGRFMQSVIKGRSWFAGGNGPATAALRWHRSDDMLGGKMSRLVTF